MKSEIPPTSLPQTNTSKHQRLPQSELSNMMHFKDDVLRDLKWIDFRLTNRLDESSSNVEKKLQDYEWKISAWTQKVSDLSNWISTDRNFQDKLDYLSQAKEAMNTSILSHEVKISSVSNEIQSAVFKYDKFILENIMCPGWIGTGCRYKSFHDFIKTTITAVDAFNTYKQQQVFEFKSYKNKLESWIEIIQSNMVSSNARMSEFTIKTVNDSQDQIREWWKVYDDRLEDMRVENSKYSIQWKQKCEHLNAEWAKIIGIKDEIYNRFDKEVHSIKEDNRGWLRVFDGYQTEFKWIKTRFTQWSNFIKDVRFKINIGKAVKNQEFKEVSTKLDFDRRQRWKDGEFEAVERKVSKIIMNTPAKKVSAESYVKRYISGEVSIKDMSKESKKSLPTSNGFPNNLNRSKTLAPNKTLKNMDSLNNVIPIKGGSPTLGPKAFIINDNGSSNNNRRSFSGWNNNFIKHKDDDTERTSRNNQKQNTAKHKSSNSDNSFRHSERSYLREESSCNSSQNNTQIQIENGVISEEDNSPSSGWDKKDRRKKDKVKKPRDTPSHNNNSNDNQSMKEPHDNPTQRRSRSNPNQYSEPGDKQKDCTSDNPVSKDKKITRVNFRQHNDPVNLKHTTIDAKTLNSSKPRIMKNSRSTAGFFVASQPKPDIMHSENISTKKSNIRNNVFNNMHINNSASSFTDSNYQMKPTNKTGYFLSSYNTNHGPPSQYYNGNGTKRTNCFRTINYEQNRNSFNSWSQDNLKSNESKEAKQWDSLVRQMQRFIPNFSLSNYWNGDGYANTSVQKGNNNSLRNNNITGLSPSLKKHNATGKNFFESIVKEPEKKKKRYSPLINVITHEPKDNGNWMDNGWISNPEQFLIRKEESD